MNKLLFIFLFFFSSVFANEVAPAVCLSPPIRIAVIDTGFGYNNLGHSATLCRFGHKDFTKSQKFTDKYGTIDKVPLDLHGHGTNIAGIIDTFGKKGQIN